ILTLEAADAVAARLLLRETGVNVDAVFADRDCAQDQVEGLRALAPMLEGARVAVIPRRDEPPYASETWTVLREPLNASSVLEFIAEAAPMNVGVFPGSRPGA
ncbi:MAG: hypothetical protein AAFU55_11250, partial [Pseudomonadota bacterium]